MVQSARQYVWTDQCWQCMCRQRYSWLAIHVCQRSRHQSGLHALELTATMRTRSMTDRASLKRAQSTQCSPSGNTLSWPGTVSTKDGPHVTSTPSAVDQPMSKRQVPSGRAHIKDSQGPVQLDKPLDCFSAPLLHGSHDAPQQISLGVNHIHKPGQATATPGEPTHKGVKKSFFA